MSFIEIVCVKLEIVTWSLMEKEICNFIAEVQLSRLYWGVNISDVFKHAFYTRKQS